MATNGDKFLGTILHKTLSNLWVQVDAKHGKFAQSEAAKIKPVQKIHLFCGMCNQECVVNVEPLYTSYKSEIDENDGLVQYCLPKIIIESYLHKHIFNNLANEDKFCVPVLPATPIEWKTSDYEVPSFPSGCNKLKLYLQSKSDQSIHEEIEKSTDDDWVLRSELAGYFLSFLTKQGDNTLVTKVIRLKEKLCKDLKQKFIEYCPEYYQNFYKKASDTNSSSSTESDDSSTPENQQKPKSKKGRRKPEFFHQHENYCEMKPKKNQGLNQRHGIQNLIKTRKRN